MGLHRVFQPNRTGWQFNTGQVYFGPDAKHRAAVDGFDDYLSKTRPKNQNVAPPRPKKYK